MMAIDMVGHGTLMPRHFLRYAMLCGLLLNFLDGIGFEKAYISGESLGATVAAWFAIAHPNRVEKIVMNTGMLLPPDEDGAAGLRGC
ncbi:MAG: hypothetical protein CM15mP125_0790 [Gammaproteobacteria bacterium]|nr:MAG: hypothetical protein CM15mP125_0790 [Gammaproteobacteria bacterium]